MPPFQNEFSWSPSRHRMFESCKRQYYYNYYGSWNGWSRDAEPQAQLLYRLKKMTTVPQLIGTVVHEVISQVLEAVQTRREVIPASVETFGQKLFNRHLQDSETQRWLQSASKFTNLFEHYYNEPFSETDRTNAGSRITTSLTTFFESDAFATLQATPPEHYLTNEELTSFTLADTKVWVTLDVAIRNNKQVYVYDWKTGREREADRHQLAVYALYATTQWGIVLPDLQLQDVYLQANKVTTVDLTPDDLDQTRTFVTDSARSMRARLNDPLQNTASSDAFPMTDNTAQCTSCPFKAVCYPDAEPTQNPVIEQEPVQLSLF